MLGEAFREELRESFREGIREGFWEALALRFPVFGRRRRSGLTFSNVSGPLTLSHYACAAKRAQPV